MMTSATAGDNGKISAKLIVLWYQRAQPSSINPLLRKVLWQVTNILSRKNQKSHTFSVCGGGGGVEWLVVLFDIGCLRIGGGDGIGTFNGRERGLVQGSVK